MKKREDAKLPEFQSLDEERNYWEAHGPLAEGHKGRVNKPKPGQTRSSFLAVRLTGEELTRLREIAAHQGVGPSTFARLLLTTAIERQARLPKNKTLDDVMEELEKNFPHEMKERMETILKAITIGEPPYLLELTDKKKLEEFALSFLSALFAMAGVQVITPEDEKYQEVKESVKARS
jgi:hypothetical protein